MRVSDFYKLPYRQDGLDFVDVDIVGDDPLFVDPRALRTLHTPWADECVSLIQDFFGVVLTATRDGSDKDAIVLLRHLREPNETHLGLSRGAAKGRALGPVSARDLWEALVGSEAIRSGLLEDLEETVLMIEGVSFDIVSDIATNIIREPLIRFTQEQAELYDIPMQDVDSGPLWDPGASQWTQRFERLPTPDGRKLILVPKVIARRKLHYEPSDYFSNYVLTFLMEEEISANSELVHLLKDGTPRVTKKDLVAKYGAGKHIAVEITKRHPEILDQFRIDKQKQGPVPLDHEALAAEMAGTPVPDWDALLLAVTSVAPGGPGAAADHPAIQPRLTPLFHPDLVLPRRETPLHEGRKRIDLTYSNMAQSGFFAWVATHHPAMYVLIECKNYAGDPANPELDQLAGRFGPSRGRVGILVCRPFEDKDLFIKRCRDTASDQRGFIMPLDDGDLTMLVERRRVGDVAGLFNVLKERFDQIVM
jgi:hypothetical protein